MIRRDTKQRHLILNAVRARCDHPTADQIYDDVHKQNARISRGTVYRNLNFLCEEGAICHVRVPGADRYDLRTDLHYHMFCIICKKVIDAPYPYKTFLDDEIAKKTEYKISRHRLIFEGICPTCQSNEIILLRGRCSFVLQHNRFPYDLYPPLLKRKSQAGKNDYENKSRCHDNHRRRPCSRLRTVSPRERHYHTGWQSRSQCGNAKPFSTIVA